MKIQIQYLHYITRCRDSALSIVMVVDRRESWFLFSKPNCWKFQTQSNKITRLWIYDSFVCIWQFPYKSQLLFCLWNLRYFTEEKTQIAWKSAHFLVRSLYPSFPLFLSLSLSLCPPLWNKCWYIKMAHCVFLCYSFGKLSEVFQVFRNNGNIFQIS